MTTISPETHHAIHRAIIKRGQATIDLLLSLVAVPSVTGSEGAVQAVVRSAYEQRGLIVDSWDSSREEIEPYLVHVGEQAQYVGRPSVVGRRAGTGSDGSRSLMLQGHIDTVDWGEREHWRRDPAGEVHGSRVYGRGSADMKGGIITHIAALDALDAAGVTLRGDLLLASSVGEEDGGLGALSTMLRGHRADAAIITEPTNLSLVVAHGGSLVFRITVPGLSAHGGSRNQGISAVEKFIPIFQELLRWEQERNDTLHHPLYDHLQNKFPISVGLVRAGTWASTVPESLVAEGRLGFLPGETIEGMQAAAEARIQAIAEQDPWLRKHPPVIEWFGGQFAAAEVSPDEPIARVLAESHRRVTGATPTVEGVTWGADMRLLIEIGGIPTIIFGAGDVKNVHRPDEFIDIADLLTAIETLALTIAEWCGT